MLAVLLIWVYYWKVVESGGKWWNGNFDLI